MPELRKDPITGRWVIIATDRAKRPSDFIRQSVPPPAATICPFDYGNEHKTPPEVLAYRSSGARDQAGWRVRVVPNKFPVLGIEGELNKQADLMYDKMNGIGAHEVIIETPDHSATFSDLPEKQIEEVLWAFKDRVSDLKKDRRFRYILLFKNHGEAAGASLEHSHSQLIALPVIPGSVKEEVDGALFFYSQRDRCIFCDIVRQEITAGVRMVMETDRFAVLEPYAPRFPFETWILPKRHESHFEESDGATLQNLAWVLRSTMRKIDKVLERPAYNFIVHSSPVQDAPLPHYHWHIEIIPKLTKVAGFEWGTGFYINPTPPEESARFLREAGLG
ncbi:MAG TPA: galactose-1-phosphate uridylyltransferase [Candidatus Acidoferrales bacterium]|nr:galactose-1-phosphate uridylyltransferase [Candidatus Acidoferrales bacterium]